MQSMTMALKQVQQDHSIAPSVCLLKKANSSITSLARSKILEEFCSVVNDLDERCRSALISCSEFHEQLNQLILSFGIITEFRDREYTSYDKNDFKDYDVDAYAILKCVIACISLLKTQQTGCKIHPNLSCLPSQTQSQDLSVCVNRDGGDNACYVDDLNEHLSSQSQCQTIKLSVLSSILILIGGNIRRPIWSSNDCFSLSEQLLNGVMDLMKCHSIHEILVKSEIYDRQDDSKAEFNNMIDYLFNVLKIPLSRDKWEKNPFLCEVFSWLILNVKSPFLSGHIDQIMATSLNFIHSHEVQNKLLGLHSLQHLIQNVSGEELRWYNRAEVIYDTLKHQMYSKEELVLDSVLKCIFLILKVLERKPMEVAVKHHDIMSNILQDTEMENLIITRRVWISNLARFIVQCGIQCIQHLSKILQVIEIFLDVEDSPFETSRINALLALENVMIVSWPRMRHHSENTLQFLLKLMINLESSDIKCDVKKQLASKIIVCVRLLLKINPNLNSDLKEIKQSGKLIFLKNFINHILLEADSNLKEFEGK